MLFGTVRQNKTKAIIILAAELALILAAFLFTRIQIRKFTPVDYSINDWTCHYSVYHDGAFAVEEENLNNGEEITFLYGPGRPMKKGTYIARIRYDAERDQYCEASGANIDNFMIIPADFVKGSRGILSASKDSIDYHFEVPEDVQKLNISIHYNGIGSFSVSSIEIKQTAGLYKRNLATLVFLVILADCALLVMNCGKNTRRNIGLVLAIGFAASIPLFFRLVGTGNIGDMDFHMIRIDAVANALRDRQFPVRVSNLWMDGYGFPTSIYYNDILLMFPALLRLLGYDLIVSMKIYLICINLLTAAIALWSFKRLFRSSRTTLILTATYVLAPYRLSYCYAHSAVGEFSAVTFLPLIAYGMVKMYTENADDWKHYRKYGIIMALGITGVAAAHVLTLVISVFFMGLAGLILIRKTLRKNTLRLWIDTALLSLVLNAYFLVPFADYYFNMETLIKQNAAIRGYALMQNYGVSLGRMLSFFPSSYKLGIVRVLSPGIVLMTAFGAGIYRWYRTRDKKLGVYLILSGIALFMSMDCFPWNFLEMHTFLGRTLAQMQYPFRILNAADLLLCLVLGELIASFSAEGPETLRKLRCGVLLLNLVFLVFFVSDYSTGQKMEKKYETEALDTFATSLHYLPAGSSTDRYAYTKGIRSEGVEECSLISRKTHETRFHARSENGGSLEVPVLNYRYYRVSDSSGNEYEIFNGENNRIRFMIPAGADDIYSIRFSAPWFWTAAIFVSLAGFTVLLITQRMNMRSAKKK